MADSFKMEVVITRWGWMNATQDWGIFSFTPKNREDIEKYNLKMNNNGEYSINGSMPRLDIGATYIATLTEKNNKKYGVGYEVKSIYQDIPSDKEDQRKFLSTLLTPLQVQAIYDVYDGQDVLQMIKDNTFDYRKVKGFGEATYTFVRNKILTNIELQEALIELSEYGLNYNMVSKLVQKYGSASLLVQKVSENPYVLTEVNGIGFVKCDKYALKMGIEKDSVYRIQACVEYILEEEANNNGNCWVELKELLSQAKKLLRIEKKKILEVIEEIGLGNENIHVDFDDNKIGLMSNYNNELSIYENVKRIVNAPKTIQVKDFDSKIEEVQKKLGFELTDEQREGVRRITEENFVIISGKAGTGKTTILKVAKMILDTSMHGCALSGKASQRIVEGAGLNSSTIHRMLGYNGYEGFAYGKEFPLPYNVVVLDEASMVNNYIFRHVLEAIESGKKIVVLGDIEQLEPIGAGNVLKDMIESKEVPTVTLTVVHRQALRSGILSVANVIREGRQFNDKENFKNRVIGDLKDLYFKPYKSPEKVFNQVIKQCENYSKSGNVDLMNFQVIAPMKNKGFNCTKNLNIELQKIFNPDDKPYLKRGNFDFKQGDKIIQNGNNYQHEVFNGTLGIIDSVNVDNKSIIINFSGVGLVEYSQEEMGQIDMAYALTVHKVQGSQFENVIFAMDYQAYILLSRQLVYTAITRASKLCMLICENSALIHAIRTNKSSKRNTFLLDFLKTA